MKPLTHILASFLVVALQKHRARAFLLALAMLATGCIAPRSYVDAKFHAGAQNQSHRIQNRPVRLTVLGQTNGRENSAATRFWKSQVEKSLIASGCFVIAPSGDELNITINNIGDLGSAASSGFATGLTFGAVGSNVTDRYVMTVNYGRGGGTRFNRTYEHALHTVVGNARAPEGAIGPMSPMEAAAQVGDDLIRRFINDLK